MPSPTSTDRIEGRCAGMLVSLIKINDRPPPLCLSPANRRGAGIAMDTRCSKGRVKAIFADSTLQFEVAADITLEGLCALLARWGRGHGDAVLVEVAWSPRLSDESGP